MSDSLGFSRNVVNNRYALLTPAGFVPSNMPGWNNVVFNVLISPAMGAKFSQHLVTFLPDGVGAGNTGTKELFSYAVSGTTQFNRQTLDAGAFAYLPPATDYSFTSKAHGARLLLFEKPYEPLAGAPASKAIVIGHEKKMEPQPFLGDPDVRLQTLLPDTPAFDMAVNIFTYKPGATLPVVETHVMEHGVMILEGQGIYRLDADWHPVQAGDVIWMSAYCPQWFAATGKTPARYIYYKNVNRQP